MLLHVGLLMEPFATELARVRSRVRVDQQMRGQRRGPLERFTAKVALWKNHVLLRILFFFFFRLMLFSCSILALF